MIGLLCVSVFNVPLVLTELCVHNMCAPVSITYLQSCSLSAMQLFNSHI